MKIEAYVGITRSDNLIVIQTLSCVMVLHGSTMTASAPLSAHIQEFSIRQTKGEETGLVALELLAGGPSAFVTVNWAREQPIDRSAIFIPHPDRMAQIVDHHLEVVTPSGIYSSKKIEPRFEQKVFYVQNGNLLCRFIAGLMTEEELQAYVAGQTFVEDMAAQVERYMLDNQRLADANRELERDRDRLVLKQTSMSFRIGALSREIHKRWPRFPFRRRLAAILRRPDADFLPKESQ